MRDETPEGGWEFRQPRGYDVGVDPAVEEDAGFRLPLKYPVELLKPAGFDPERLETWPKLDGRMEYVGGRLLYMPPCGETQAAVVFNLSRLMGPWARANPDFWAGSNESGMSLAGDRRGADVGVWKRREGALKPGFANVAPVLAVEVEGKYEDEQALREKTRWYFDHGVKIVWLVYPSRREIIAVTSRGESRHKVGDSTPEHAELPGLRVPVDEVFFGLRG